jgi:hypothetical protein
LDSTSTGALSSFFSVLIFFTLVVFSEVTLLCLNKEIKLIKIAAIEIPNAIGPNQAAKANTPNIKLFHDFVTMAFAIWMKPRTMTIKPRINENK